MFLNEALEEQGAIDVKFHHDYYKSLKNESKETRESVKIRGFCSDLIEN